LVGQLDSAWSKSDWPAAIDALRQLRRINPDSKDYRDKLYSAYFAYGKALLKKGDTANAVAQFILANETDPSRTEAAAQLQALTPTATPAPPTPTPLVCKSTFDDFCLVSTTGQLDSFGGGYVTGVVINTGSRRYSYVQVEVTLLDASGAVVGSALANVNNLGPGETWKFRAPFFDSGVSTFRVEKVIGF
jgi:hypothetical protein